MGLHRITLPVIIVMVFLVLVACQESEENVYLDKMWAWHSLEGYAFSFESQEAMLAELEAIDPGPGWYGQPPSLTATYRASLSAERAEDVLREIEVLRFIARGDPHNPSCDILRYLYPPASLEYQLACQTSWTAFLALSTQKASWEIDYLLDRSMGYRLREDAYTLSRGKSIEVNSAEIMDQLTQIARKHR